MYLITEAVNTMSKPKSLKNLKNDRVRMECVLQTTGDINRNKRRYSRKIMEEGLSKIQEKFDKGNLYGELDHPVDGGPQRQMNVLFKEVSHRIVEVGWDNSKLVGVLETTRSPNGYILKNFAEDGMPVGFSFRGMGELKKVQESSNVIFDVCSPIHVVTWDSVTSPSHRGAELIRITEDVIDTIKESNVFYESSNGMICNESTGICYMPDDFDELVHKYAKDRTMQFIKKYR